MSGSHSARVCALPGSPISHYLIILVIFRVLAPVYSHVPTDVMEKSLELEYHSQRIVRRSATVETPLYPTMEPDSYIVCRGEKLPTIQVGNTVKSLVKRLSNCSVIEGNLVIMMLVKQISASNYTGISFPALREITGYFLMYRVNGLLSVGQLFPNLRIIRGNDHFYGSTFTLFEVGDLLTISLTNLVYIGGRVTLLLNPDLCFVDTINWNEIMDPNKGGALEVLGNQYKTKCSVMTDCQELKCNYCWDLDNCQRAPCRGECGNEGCLDDGTCCHTECLGGCTLAGSTRHCYSCKHIRYGGECLKSCPAKDADGNELYEMQGTYCGRYEDCVTNNTALNKVHNGKCVAECPSGMIEHSTIATAPINDKEAHKCVPCQGVCEKVCQGGTFETGDDIDVLMGCTILDNTLDLALRVGLNVNMERLHASLKDIHTIRGALKVTRCHGITSLQFLSNLRRIEIVDQYRQGSYGIVIFDNEQLREIWDMGLHPDLTVVNGKVRIQQNPNLCYKDITQLMNSIKFEGMYLSYHEPSENEVKVPCKAPDNDTYCIKPTKEAHTEFDISSQNNGQEGHCYVSSQFLKVTVDPFNLVTVNFSAYTGERRFVISYTIFYKKVEDGETVNYYSSIDMCDKDLTAWSFFDYDDFDEFEDYYEHLMFNLEAFQSYALYVQTYVTLKIAGAHSRTAIAYFKTKPAVPDPVTIRNIVQGNPGPHGNQTTLKVSWDPPEKPNGKIKQYIVYFRPVPWPTEGIERKDHCKPYQRVLTNEKVYDVPSMSMETSEIKANDTCACEIPTTKKPQTNQPNRMTREQLTLLKYSFENFLQNSVFQKNPVKLQENPSIEEEPEEPITTVTKLRPTTVTPVTVSPVSSVSTTERNSVITTTTTKAPEVMPYSTVNVQHPTTTVEIYSLLPYTEYSVEIVACHAYDNATEKTLCSERAGINSGVGLTASQAELDIIPSSSFKIEPIYKGKIVVALKFSWKPPSQTNGPILLYKIRFSKAISDKSQPESSSAAKQELCVTAKEFREGNNSITWSEYSKHLHPGVEFEFSVSLEAVGTLIANWTAPISYTLPSESDKKNWAVVVALPVLFGLIFGAVLILAVWYKRKKSGSPVPLSTMFNSVNPDYLDTGDFYKRDEWEIDRAKIVLGAPLGQGSFGMVYEGKAKSLPLSKDKDVPVAIKTVNQGASVKARIEFLNEASTMKAFICNHIVKLLAVVSDGQPTLVVMELMSQGDLKNYLRKHRPDEPDNEGRRPPTLREILQMAAEIADGMFYLSEQKFVHRDLAARNCMVAADMTVKIGDFGMTRDVYDTDYYRKGGKGFLPVRWMSPEALKDGVFTTKSDVWSYGVVLWEMATLAAQPYQGLSNPQVLEFVGNGGTMEMPDGCPTRLYDLMKQCWAYHPKYRTSFTQILEQLQGDVKKSFFTLSWFYSHDDPDLLEDGEDCDMIPLHNFPHQLDEGKPLLVDLSERSHNGVAHSVGSVPGVSGLNKRLTVDLSDSDSDIQSVTPSAIPPSYTAAAASDIGSQLS